MKRILTAIAIMAASATMLAEVTALDITLPAAGTLKEYITPEQQESVTKLKVSGDINGDDLRIIRHMIGAKVSSSTGRYAEVDSGACRVLDLSEANIIGEGFYTFKYVPKPSEGPAYYLPGLEVEANKITYAMFCGSKVETLILPNSVTYIGCTHRGTTTADHCIDGSHLKSVTLPEKLEHMEVYGTGQVLRHRDEGPDYYEEVPQQNLLDSPNLAEVKIADSNPNFKIIDGVLYRGDLTELMLCPPKREGKLEIPAETTKIGYRACAGTHITGDLHITSPDIAPEAFSGATIDGVLIFEKIVSKIPSRAFSNINLKGIILSDYLTEIESYAFSNSSLGEELIIGRNVKTLQSHSFEGCSFKRLTMLSATPFQVNAVDPYGMPENKNNIFVFANNLELEEVVLAQDVNSIPEGTFKNCISLSSFDLFALGELEFVGKEAFYNCPLEKVVVPEGIKYLGFHSFFYEDIDSRHRDVLIPPINGQTNKYLWTEIATPNDDIYLWIDPDNISGSTPTFPPTWAEYAVFGHPEYDDGWHISPPISELQGIGHLYIPEGAKQNLYIYLTNQIERAGEDYSKRRYPMLLYIPFEQWYEIKMRDFPNFEKSDGLFSIGFNENETRNISDIYDLSGRRLNEPLQGINIVRYSDGTVKKEFVK